MKIGKKIVLVLPYFGKFPELARLFFYTAGLNSQLQFLLFTDQEKPQNLSSNFQYVKSSINWFNKLATKKLGLKVKVINPYKLCDFKPMYGKIFEDYIYDSDFWGYCDLDMIFGETAHFLTPDILENYDIITSRKNSLAGNFTIYKNKQQLVLLYQQSDCWQQIVLNNRYLFSFPEKFKPAGKPLTNKYFTYLLFKHKSPVIYPAKVPDINTILYFQSGIKTFYGDFILSDEILKNNKIENWKVIWKDGKLYSNDSIPILYFHFYYLKNIKNYRVLYLKSLCETNEIQISQKSVSLNIKEHLLCK